MSIYRNDLAIANILINYLERITISNSVSERKQSGFKIYSRLRCYIGGSIFLSESISRRERERESGREHYIIRERRRKRRALTHNITTDGSVVAQVNSAIQTIRFWISGCSSCVWNSFTKRSCVVYSNMCKWR